LEKEDLYTEKVVQPKESIVELITEMSDLAVTFKNFIAPSSNVIKGLHGLGNLLGKSDYYPKFTITNITVGGTIENVGGIYENGEETCTNGNDKAKDTCIIGGTWDRRCVGIIMGHISIS